MPGLHTPPQFASPHFSNRKSFQKAEAEARKLLKERGLTDEQIEAELHRAKRDWLD